VVAVHRDRRPRERPSEPAMAATPTERA